jgi:hypothetical protein
MTTFLLLLSLILNAGTIFAIILLYLRQNRLVDAEKKQERIIGEIEEVFTSYLIQLKEENEQFLELIKKTDHVTTSSKFVNEEVHKQEVPVSGNSAAGQTEPPLPRIGKGISYHAARNAYHQSRGGTNSKQISESAVDLPPLPVSMLDQVIQLKNQGMSIEGIARSLNKGKTEIELLLKFRQKEQE